MFTLANNCPHCNSSINNELRDDYFYTCDNCQKPFIYKTDKSVIREYINSETEILSPVLIGSKGKYQAESFRVTGSIILYKTRTVMAIHSVLLNNDTYNFIVETEGHYCYINYVSLYNDAQIRKSAVGKSIMIDTVGKAFCNIMDKVLSIALVGSGKLPVPFLTDAIWCSYLMSAKKANFIVATKDQINLLSGKYIDIDELNLNPIRNYNDWIS